MSTQAYYKDRLGFDPREALHDSNGAPIKGGGKNHQQQKSGHRHNNDKHHYDYTDSPNPKKQKQQEAYEDALTQFKGTMSVWEFFVENRDVEGMSNKNGNSHSF